MHHQAAIYVRLSIEPVPFKDREELQTNKMPLI